MKSCIYEGQVRHRRFSPSAHEFNYNLFLLYLDLDELDVVFNKRWLWSTKSPALARFKREDYIGDPSVSIKEAVNCIVKKETGEIIKGPVRVLTHLRYFGHIFNPVTFYYCFDKAGENVETIVAEITNTPWKERHSYVLNSNSSDKKLHFQFNKIFHVSPFMHMNMSYDWRFTKPEDLLNVHMINTEKSEKIFDATLRLQRKEISFSTCARALIMFPLITIKVVTGIYWQAFRLYLKRTPFYTHPEKAENNEGGAC
ncbi:MAG: DUF1365 domain-containing protein [Gammaproteobacteria bacterium]|nr:DUF1365 domain-containing protein [Gammaproteobacteria bacterium]